jgi:alkanesulfonate monooxygenase SsuD/methylene tetrahydromethanopterin reductase-like flavin-dependent oxidoreductase (luciferase family)
MPNAGDPRDLVELAIVAESTAWDGFFLWDHLQLDAASRPAMLDPWVVLGAIAARTTRIRIGAMVTPLARRRPWKLAKEITTLDHLSHGRVIVGVGLGVPPDIEYGAFGEPVEARVHAAMLDEGLPLLDSFLRGDPVDHDGEHYQVHAHLSPAAFQRPRRPSGSRRRCRTHDRSRGRAAGTASSRSAPATAHSRPPSWPASWLRSTHRTGTTSSAY